MNMSFWSILLFPIAFLYGAITFFRNKLYDFKIFKSYSVPIKSIVVGNLAVGGTGKTPHVFYISRFLSKQFKVAILSRGYARKTKGYKDVNIDSNAKDVGDEPLLLKQKLGDEITVAVCEERSVGIKKLIQKLKIDVIVLDDAFQHRKINAGLNLILTEFNRPFFNDFPLPMGRLREFHSGKKRADIFIVSKCPDNLSQLQKDKFIHKIGFDRKYIFFSKIIYAPFQSISTLIVQNIKSILLVTAIADDSILVEYLSKSFSVKTFKFRDHHTFSEEDIKKIHLKFDTLPKSNGIILTTEKDFVKLIEFDKVTKGQYPWYFLPIDIEIDRENEFNQLLTNYVGAI